MGNLHKVSVSQPAGPLAGSQVLIVSKLHALKVRIHLLNCLFVVLNSEIMLVSVRTIRLQEYLEAVVHLNKGGQVIQIVLLRGPLEPN